MIGFVGSVTQMMFMLAFVVIGLVIIGETKQ